MGKYVELDEAGLEYEKAIERFAGNEALFFKFLYRFPVEPTYGAILDEYSNMNKEALYEQLHTLKGVAGNLGLMSIYELCKSGMEAVHSGDDVLIEQKIIELKDEHTKICDLINEFQKNH